MRIRLFKTHMRFFDAYKDFDAEYWGFKEEPLPLSQMKDLYAYMKSCDKKQFWKWLHIHRQSVCQVQNGSRMWL